MENYFKYLTLIMVSWTIKILLIPAYYSTDFAVHQNWLYITHTKSISEWYHNTESKWTLDYPPFFAYFEYVLSIVASFFDENIVNQINEKLVTIYYQRVSVIVLDLFYLFVLSRYVKSWLILTIAYLWIPFVILDNVHFQYNLAMQAILVLAVGLIKEKKYLMGAFTYAILLNFKHMYLYSAPAFFIYLLKDYIFANDEQNEEIGNTIESHLKESKFLRSESSAKELWIFKLIKLSIVTLIPFIISFGPFFIIDGLDELTQIMSRLFPFSRGLVHEYWAPNLWALYYFLDKILFIAGFRTKNLFHETGMNALRVLPNVTPSVTMVLTLIGLLPLLIKYTISKNKKIEFTQLVSLSGLIFFSFGFHVHEKAITPYLALLFLFDPQMPGLSTAIYVNIVNLIPLLIEPGEKIFGILCCMLWICIWECLESKTKKPEKFSELDLLALANSGFIAIIKLIPIFINYLIQTSGLLILIFHLFIHPILNKPSLEFLPLMINSVWAASFNLYWISYIYCKILKNEL